MTADIQVREVDPGAFAEASRVAARSLVHLFSYVGEDPVDRLVAAYRTYAYEGLPPEHHLAVAAYADGHPVAVARATTPGHCHCDLVEGAAEPTTDEERGLLAYRRFLLDHHPGEPHWWFGPVGVEPGLERRGLGRLVMERALELIGRRGGGPVVLEAAPDVAGFYRTLGFRDLTRQIDPDGDDLFVQRLDLSPEPGTS
jgi:ribosomal protein S18 acetylase RimI-like enzyme